MEELNERNFTQATNHQTCIVDFYGNGCINCRMLEPTLKELETEYPNIKFFKVNVDNAPNLVKQYMVTALPTLLMIKHGQVIPSLAGLKPKNVIRRAIENLLN